MNEPTEAAAIFQSDEAILGIDDSPGLEGSEVSSSPADTSDVDPQVETQQPGAAADATTDQTEALAQPDQQGKPQQQPTQPQAQTPEQAEQSAKAQAFDMADEVLTSGDTVGQVELIQDIFAGNPASEAHVGWNLLQHLAETSPEHSAQLSRAITSSDLQEAGLRGEIESLYSTAERSGNRQLMAAVQQFAGKVNARYGLWMTPEQNAAQYEAYLGESLKELDSTMQARILRAFGPQLANASPADRQEVLKAVDLEIKALGTDRRLKAEYDKLRGNYSPREGSRVHHSLVDSMVARANHAILRLKTEYASLFKATPPKPKAQAPAPQPKPAQKLPSSWAEARAQGKNAKDIADMLRESQADGWQTDRPMAHEESRNLSDKAIWETKRQGQTRKPYVPGNELDEL